MRMLKTLLCALTALVSCEVLAAVASDQAIIDEAYGALGSEENVKHLDYMARCVVNKYPLAADAFVMNTTDAMAMLKDQARLLDDKCMKQYWFRGSNTNFEPGMYRAIVAEALVGLALADKSLAVQLGDVPVADKPRLPGVLVSDVHPYYRPTFVVDQHEAQLSQFADCAVRSRPDAIVALAATKRGGAEEAAALADLEAAPAECTAKRPSVSFPTFARRGELMLQLYLLSRLSGAPVPEPLAKGRR